MSDKQMAEMLYGKSYVHKWVNDGFYFFAFDENGAGFEWNEKPQVGSIEWKGDKSRFVGAFSGVKWRESLIQRYTDQQMELEADGWTLWNAGDEIPNVDVRLMVDIHDNEHYDTETSCEPFGNFSWSDDMNAIAYRLSNADGYKDGVKSIHKHESSHEGFKEFITPEDSGAVAGFCSFCANAGFKYINCKKIICEYCNPLPAADGVTDDTAAIQRLCDSAKPGKLPPLGTECKVLICHVWHDCKIVGQDCERAVFYVQGIGYDASKNPDLFKATQTEKERVTDLVIESIEEESYLLDLKGLSLREIYRAVLGDAYDAGMLIDPDKGET